MTFTLKTFDQLTTRELHKIYQLRSAIFVVEQACAYQDIDDQDLTALHLFLEEEGQLLAYCRLIPTTDLVKLGRVVVAKTARGQGVGRQLVEEALAACASHYPKKPIYAQAQAHLEAFYQSLGFVATSDSYLEDGIPHIDMIRKGSSMTDFHAILEAIKAHQTIIIHRHQKPDPDAIGSQVGLAEIIRYNFPDKRVLVTGYDEPTLTWLATMDQVGEQDYEGALVIVTDTANLDRIDDGRYDQGALLIKLDHHPNDQPYGDLCLVDTTASSASEMVTDLALTTGLNLPLSAVRLLYAGIVGDTGRFLFPNATAKTFSIAGELRSYDVDFSLLMRQMDSMSAKVAKLMGHILDQLTIDETGAAYVVLTTELLNRYGVTPNEVSLVVGTPGKIDSVESWAIFTQQDSGHYRVNLRSKSVIINALAKEHDGGGHPLASGAWAYSEDEVQIIWNKLKQLVAESKHD